MASTSPISDSTRRPLIGASIAVWRDGQVLLAQRDRPPFAGTWSLPGGSVEVGETVEAAALREAKEETGVNARSLGLATYLDVIRKDEAGDIAHHFVLLVFAGAYESGKAYAGDGTRAVCWVKPERIAGLETTARLGDAIAATQDVYRRSLSG